MSIFSFADRYDAAIDARRRTCQRWHDMAAATIALHRIHIHLNQDRLIL